ncbi:PAS domain S-box protein [Halopenitus salinus]|uniref:histidine kinase n=1 Tax=Halopenitus salinus TaxID=1198295 RepID=A0ABD5UW62_9EURY
MTEPIRVLHVDDDASFGELAADFLERVDDRFEVRTAHDASEGLDRITERTPDCIVSDYEMPGPDGLEFLENVREEHPDLPFILFTGKGSEEVASDAISAGATDYLQKGSDTEQYELLANRIRNVVEQNRSQSALERERSRMEFALRSTDAAVWTRDLETDEMEIHPSECPVFETSIDSFEDFLEQVHSTDRRTVEDRIRSAARSGESYSVRFRFDDGTRWGEMNGRTVSEGGDPAVQTGITRDITERVERKRRFETLTSNLPGMVYRCLNESGWPIEEVHGDVAEFTGYSADDLEADGRLWFEEVMHPEDKGETRERIRQSLRTGDSFEETYRIRTADGDVRWVRERGRGVYGPEGELEAFEGFITDVTEHREAESRLRETNRRFEAVLDTVEAAIFIKDAEGRYQLANPACRDVLGVDPGTDVTGLTDHDLFPDAVADRLREDDRRVLEEGRTIEFEETIPGTDEASTRLTLKSPLYDDAGAPIGICAVSTDISDRKRRERERRRNERRFQAMFDDPNILVGLLEPDGTVVDVNRTAMGYVDADREDVVGRPFPETPWWRPEHESALREWIDRAARGEYVEYGVEHSGSDGDTFSVEGTIMPVTDDGEAVESLIVSARETTERDRRERELERIRDRMEFALDRTDSVIWERDPGTGEITTYPDPCPVLEATITSLDDYLERVHPDHRDRLRETLGPVPDPGESRSVEVRTIPEVEAEWVRSRVRPHTDEEGTISHVVGVSRDVTAFKRRERRLERHNERFEKLASVVSHDLQSPIQAVRGRLELAADTGDQAHVEAALSAFSRLEEIRTDLIEMLRTGEVVTETEPIDVGALAEDVWDRVAAADASTLEVVSNPHLEGDPGATERLLQNLLSNAVEHADGETTVEIGRIESGFYLEDDGPGIDPEDRTRVFDPGFTTKSSGQGMGMASVRQIVDEHGWTIDITDAESLEGARFEIRT